MIRRGGMRRNPAWQSLQLDFTAEAAKSGQVACRTTLAQVVQGRLYVRADPGAGFSESVILSLYEADGLEGREAVYRFVGMKAVYTELKTATVVGTKNVAVDDSSDIADEKAVYILDTINELARIADAAADPMQAEDNLLAVHAIDSGVALVEEFGAAEVRNTDGESVLNVEVAFVDDAGDPKAVTVGMQLDLLIG